jgi:hypothetical protein
MLIKLIIPPIVFDINFRNSTQKIAVTIINQNKIIFYIKDYSDFIAGGTQIKKYICSSNQNISPTIKFMYNTKFKKELLLIIESWGKLNDKEDQLEFMKYFLGIIKQKNNFNIQFGETCFNGNTSAAEGRELLNMNDEESYRGFLNKGLNSQFNIVNYKNRNNYFTISSFSGSKEYGSNWANAEGFRRKLNFKGTFYFEDFNNNKFTNHENDYKSVNDEIMIDSLFNVSYLHKNIFAYGLTINTHAPFKLEKSNINIVDYTLFKEKFKALGEAIDQLYRIKMIIEYTLYKLDENSFEKILIIGDHAPPEFSSKTYSNEKVPFILIEKIK